MRLINFRHKYSCIVDAIKMLPDFIMPNNFLNKMAHGDKHSYDFTMGKHKFMWQINKYGTFGSIFNTLCAICK